MDLFAYIGVVFLKHGAAMFLLAVSQAMVAHSREYFVSPSGSPGNTGTETSPWPSITFAFSRATGGDVITLLPGVYQEEVVVEFSGITGNPTTLRSQHKWEAVIQNSPSHGIYVANGVTNVLIDGLRVAASGIDGVKVGSHATVRNCWIHDSARQGVSAHGTLGVLLERNLVEHNGSDPVFDHGIYLSGTNNIVRCNVIRWNKCFGCQIYADDPAGTENCQFYNNLVYGNRNALTIWSLAGQTNHVFNNTLSANRYVLRANGGTVCASNNILLGPSPQRIFSASSGAEFQADYNVISVTGRRRGTHDVMVDQAGFAAIDRGLFWLRAGSAARGTATTDVLPPVDFFGRVQSEVSDSGAFQFDAELAADVRVLDPSPAKPDYWATNFLGTP